MQLLLLSIRLPVHCCLCCCCFCCCCCSTLVKVGNGVLLSRGDNADYVVICDELLPEAHALRKSVASCTVSFCLLLSPSVSFCLLLSSLSCDASFCLSCGVSSLLHCLLLSHLCCDVSWSLLRCLLLCWLFLRCLLFFNSVSPFVSFPLRCLLFVAVYISCVSCGVSSCLLFASVSPFC